MPAQTVNAYFPDNSPATGSGSDVPFNFGNYTTVMVFPASTLIAQGIHAGNHLTGLAVIPVSALVAPPVSTPTARISIGHTSTDPTVPNQWINNLTDALPVWNTAVDGPLTFPP